MPTEEAPVGARPYARSMTTARTPPLRSPARAVAVLRTVGLFVVGVMFDTVCVMNVPGSATFTPGAQPTARITTQGVVFVLLAVACWVSVFFRRKAPLVVAIAGGVLLVIGISYALALIGVLHLLVRYPRKTRLISAITIAAVLFYLVREALTDWGHAFAWLFGQDAIGSDPGWIVASLAIAVLSLGLVGALAAYRRARAEASVSRVRVEQLHEHADALGEQVARQAERERIARDLHDGLGHRLSSMALAAGAFESQVAAAPIDPELANWARLVRSQAHAALEEVRGVVGGLRAEPGVESPLSYASMRMIGGLLGDLRSAGHRIDAYVLIESPERVDAARDAAAFRILQEALTNAIRHAPGSPISVTVDAAQDRGIRIRVVNALPAASWGSAGGRRGIEGIRERAAGVGGTAWIGPHDGQFLVDISLPGE